MRLNMNKLALPKPNEIMKVIQLYINSTPLLVCGSEDRFHGQILEDVLINEGITELQRFEEMTSKGPFKFTEPRGSHGSIQYKLVGAGSCQNIGPFYSFYGESTTYREREIAGINQAHLDEIQRLNPGLKLEKTD